MQNSEEQETKIEIITGENVISLYDQYKEALRKAKDHKNLKGNSLYALLPPHLQAVFTGAAQYKRTFTDIPLHRALVTNLKDEILEKLPDFTATIDPKHAEGFFINGKFREILMDQEFARRKLLPALKGLSHKNVTSTAVVRLKERYDEKSIGDVVACSFPLGADRCLVTNIVQIANSMK